MNPQLVNPSLHIILIHFPIGILMAGTVIELFAFLWPRSGFRAAGRWMILIGALACIPALTTGLYAARQVMGGDPDQTWSDLKQTSHLTAEQWDTLHWHLKFNLAAAEILVVLVVVWLGASDNLRRKAHLLFLLLLLGAAGLMSAAAWRGGELIFAQSTGINLVKGGWPTSAPTQAAPQTQPAGRAQWAFDALGKANEQIVRVDAPLDFHVLMAGFTVALALAALGLSIRALAWPQMMLTSTGEVAASDEDIFQALASKQTSAERQTLTPPVEPPIRRQLAISPPPARFWLLVVLLGLLTALLGWVVAGPASWHDAVGILQSMRARAHTIAGVSMVVLSLILAIVTRWAPHNKLLVGGFALLLLVAIGIQVWLGLLLMFDSSSGPLNHLNAPTTQTTVTQTAAASAAERSLTHSGCTFSTSSV